MGSYQVSGRPWVLGGIDATSPTSVNFPMVTRWVEVHNSGSQTLRVGFSANGVAGTNYILLAANSTLGPLELKLTELHFDGGEAGGISVVAGLTFVGLDNIDNNAISPAGTNWSGSAGVG